MLVHLDTSIVQYREVTPGTSVAGTVCVTVVLTEAAAGFLTLTFAWKVSVSR